MDKLLLHSCCAPCTTYTVKYWRELGYVITSFWYNPNIHPFTEHRQRLETHREYCRKINLPLVIAPGYDMLNYFREVVNDESNRCRRCYRLRLGLAARYARENGFGHFTTTLLISPYQKLELLHRVGEEIAEKEKVRFLFADLRPGYRESRALAKEAGLYLQKYCGCVYSEWEHFGKIKI